ncbi:MAG: hypothetical protein WC507_00315 [Candidatus Paceibacterota bacterium]|nr:hypothetical protein [Candidatus Paceibacterota bacterium]
MEKDEIKKQYLSLPENIRDFLFSDDFSNVITNASVLAKLDIKQTELLTRTIGSILKGETAYRQDTFPSLLISALSISSSQAEIINNILKKQVFDVFQEELKELNQNNFSAPKISEEPLKAPERAVENEKINPLINPEPQKGNSPTPEPSIPPKSDLESLTRQEPIKIEVKPINKTTNEFKKVIPPQVSLEQQEKIKEKLLAAMSKKESSPQNILEEMKKTSLPKNYPANGKGNPEEEKSEKKIESFEPSEVLFGEGQEFKNEEKISKEPLKKPYIFDVQLKDQPKEEQKEKPKSDEPKPYIVNQPKNPFGET